MNHPGTGTHMKACVIVTYLGTLPPWMRTYLKTCYASGLDFKIITDDTTYQSRENVEFVMMTREELRTRINALGFDLPTLSNRKLCDVKILYGILFKELLQGYDYWGYGDLDVIYGNARKFVNTTVFAGCDVFICRHFLVGHGTFYRNSDRIENVILQMPRLRKRMNRETYQSLDERRMKKYLLRRKDVKLKFCTVMATDNPKTANGLHCTWSNGTLINNLTGEEVLYAHFLKTKNNPDANWAFRETPIFELTAAGFRYPEPQPGHARNIVRSQ